MKQTVLAAVLAITLGIASGFPLFTCDKLRDVDEEVDNNDQYLVKLKDSSNYKDAKHLIDFVKQYQTSLELYASNVHGSSVKSELELSENEGVLLGILSHKALTLVCLDSSVEIIIPYYPKPVVLPEGFGETENITDCPKFIPDESHSTSNEYSIRLQPKTSANNLYHIVTSMTLASQNDDTIDFKYHHSIRRGRELLMLARMNIKAVEMICNEVKVKEIKVNHGTVNKRDVTSEQEVTTSGPCDLPEHSDEFPAIIFRYKDGTDLDAIKQSVEGYTKNSAQVESAIVLKHLDIIIFKMNRAAYFQACTNQDITLVEYDQFIQPIGHCGLPEIQEEFPKYIFVYKKGADLDAIAKSLEAYNENSAEVKLALPLHNLDIIIFQMNRAAYLKACSNSEVQSVEYDHETTIAQQQQQQQQQQQEIVVEQKSTDALNICDQADSLPDNGYTYRIVIKRPGTAERKQNTCLKLIERLQNEEKDKLQAQVINVPNQLTTSVKKFWIRATSESCKTSGTEVTMTVQLSVEALKYTCGIKGLDISLVRAPPVTRLGFA